MNFLVYIFIFITKILENALATLRVIVIASGKKITGAILQFCISFMWILGTGSTIIGINKDPIKIIFFCLGALVGSFLGSITYEKVNKKDSLITYITNNENIYDILNNSGYKLTKISNNEKNIIFIHTPNKLKKRTINIIKKNEKNPLIAESKIIK